jgi:AcrR family transcriptional regulator
VFVTSASDTQSSTLDTTATQLARIAARLFAERGYDGTSVREIVEAAGTTKPTLYYHFGSKEGLAEALLTKPQARLVEQMRSVLATQGDPVVALQDLLETLFDFCREDPDRARLMFAVFFGPMSGGLGARVHSCGCELEDIWSQAVDRVVAAGTLPATRAASFLRAMRGLHTVYILDFLYKDQPLIAGAGAEIVADLLAGFRCEPAADVPRPCSSASDLTQQS